MPKMLFVALVCLMTVNFAGCNNYFEENTEIKKVEEKMEYMEDNRKKMDETEYFFKLVETDKFGDEKVIHWNGKTATMEEDPLDSFDVQDGREVTGCEEVTIPNAFKIVYSNKFVDVTIVNDTYEDYHITAEGRDIHVQLIDYISKKKELDESIHYKKIHENMLKDWQVEFFKDYELYVGIIETDAAMYAGYTLIFESDLKDVAYMISVSGIGNLEDIRLDALYIMNRFDVL